MVSLKNQDFGTSRRSLAEDLKQHSGSEQITVTGRSLTSEGFKQTVKHHFSCQVDEVTSLSSSVSYQLSLGD